MYAHSFIIYVDANYKLATTLALGAKEAGVCVCFKQIAIKHTPCTAFSLALSDDLGLSEDQKSK